jgi:hypothetical protein
MPAPQAEWLRGACGALQLPPGSTAYVVALRAPRRQQQVGAAAAQRGAWRCQPRTALSRAAAAQGEGAGDASGPPPSVVVDALVGEAFRCAPALQHLLLPSAHDLSGRAEPCQLFAPAGEAAAQGGEVPEAGPGGLRLYRCSRAALQPPLATRPAREEDCDELLSLWRAAAASEPHLVQLQVGAQLAGCQHCRSQHGPSVCRQCPRPDRPGPCTMAGRRRRGCSPRWRRAARWAR